MAGSELEPDRHTPSATHSGNGTGLVRPDLNPLSNPILAKNLGRWAHVYYTSPPEKREQAVLDLLRELKGESQPTPIPEPQVIKEPVPNKPANGNHSKPLAILPVESVSDELLSCPACLHRNAAEQRFCGICGYPLKKGSPASEPDRPVLASLSPAVSGERVDTRPADWQWLRDKTEADFRIKHEDSGAGRRGVIALLVLIVAVGVGAWYYRSQGSRPVINEKAPAPPATTQPEPAQSQAANAKPELPATPVPPSNEVKPVDHAAAQPVPARPPKTHTSQQAAALAPEGTVSNGPADSGIAELQLGRRYLEGDGVARNTQLAALFLWKSVGKENPDAVVLLSDLYARGDGVPKSCDQARVLLSAAAKNGSAAALEKLRALQRSNCR